MDDKVGTPPQSGNGKPHQQASINKRHEDLWHNGQKEVGRKPGDSTPTWAQAIPFDGADVNSPFPVHCLASWQAEWVTAEAEATQTPPDLAAMIVLAVCGAGIAKKIRVEIRPGWQEPTNIYAVVALPSGERKSAVHKHALEPLDVLERAEQARMAPRIAELASKHRILESELKAAEQAASKATQENAVQLEDEAKQLARDLAALRVPDPPQFFCDDVTPEKLSNLIARQGGRMLQASAEGTAFEIAKGRYSETANFDVYLKGHAGDTLRVGRISREGERWGAHRMNRNGDRTKTRSR